MAENDEPLDDLRAVAMQAGAAAARVVETVARDRQRRAEDDSRPVPRQDHAPAPSQEYPPAKRNAAASNLSDEPQTLTVKQGIEAELADRARAAEREALARPRDYQPPTSEEKRQTVQDKFKAMQWAEENNPELLRRYRADSYAVNTEDAWNRVDHAFIQEWKTATGDPQQTGQPAPATLPYDSPQRRAATNEAMRAAGVPDEARQAKTTADLLNRTAPQLAARSGAAAQTRVGRPSRTPDRERGR